jgi:hypothetical protein
MFTRNLENPFSSSPTCQSPPLLKSTARHCFCARSLRCCHCCHQRDAAADGRHLLRAKHRPPAPMKPSRLSATPPVHHLISSLRSFLIVATSTSQRSAMVAQPCSTPCDLPWPRAEATPRVQRQAASRYRASRWHAKELRSPPRAHRCSSHHGCQAFFSGQAAATATAPFPPLVRTSSRDPQNGVASCPSVDGLFAWLLHLSLPSCSSNAHCAPWGGCAHHAPLMLL